jgi:hypothetical protein
LVGSFAACVGDEPSATVVVAAEGGGTDGAPSGQDSSAPDATADAADSAPEGPRCDPTKPFGDPVLMPGPINSPDGEIGFTLTSDELIAVVARRAQFAKTELRYATRTSRTAQFGAPDFDKVGAIKHTEDFEEGPSLGASGLTIYFHRSITSSSKEVIHFATRGTVADPFSLDEIIFVNAVAIPHGVAPKISRDGLRLYYTDIDGDSLYMAKRTTGPGAFAPAVNVGGFVGPYALSKDQLTLYYIELGTTSPNVNKMVVSKRANVDAAFPAGQLMPANLMDQANPLHVTDDDCILYINSQRATAGAPGGADLYEARRPL